MPKSKKSRHRWPDQDFESDHEFGETWDRQRVDPDEQDDYQDWRDERASRGRKRRDKAGGRHERTRRRDLEE